MNYWLLLFLAVFVPGIPPDAAEHQVCVGVLDDVFLSPVAVCLD